MSHVTGGRPTDFGYQDLFNSIAHISKQYGATTSSLVSLTSTLDGFQSDTPPIEALLPTVRQLVQHLHTIWTSRTSYGECMPEIMRVLADATREEERWRDYFGWQTALSDKDHTRREVDESEIPDQNRPDCILEVARQVIAASATQNTVSGKSTQHALRLIANCCADNEKNRYIIIHRDGIKDMLILAARHVELHTLIPALYNVCIDYEELSKVLVRSSSTSMETSQDRMSLSYAAEKLAMSCPEISSYATFELLLNISQECSADRVPFLAELIKMAASPSLFGLEHVFGTAHRAKSWSWSFKSNKRMLSDHSLNKMSAERNESELITDTITLAKIVHEQGEQITMCRTVLSLLSQEDAQISLIQANNDAIARVIELAYVDNTDNVDDEENVHLQKQFLRTFYELTSMPEFVDDHDRAFQLADKEAGISAGLVSSSRSRSLRDEEQAANSLLRRACTYIMLGQLASLSHIRDYLLDNERFLCGLAACLGRDDQTLSPDNIQDMYPATALVSRLAMSPYGAQALVKSGVVKSMHHLLSQSGLGLIIPYEAINAYRAILKSRPEMLVELTDVLANDHDGVDTLTKKHGIIGTITTTLYNNTIEAGTKLKIGMFVIEVFRTMFPVTKDMDQIEYSEIDAARETELKTFKAILVDLGSQLAAILGFVCSKAEPESSRVHGWFGLGMLSVWTDGRVGIANALDTDTDFRNAILATSAARQASPAIKNMTLMLSKMHQYPEGEMSVQVSYVLKTAIANLGVNLDSEAHATPLHQD